MPPDRLETRLEIQIKAPRDRVWAALTTQLDAWWPFPVSGPGTTMHLELWPGGRMYERSPTGGLLWAHVATVQTGTLLQVVGDMFEEYGGPARWYGSWTLADDDEGTTVRFSDLWVGAASERTAGQIRGGWRHLHACLGAYAEGRELPPMPT